MNNPINFNDPTGHCGADPAGSTNVEGIDATQLCVELRDFLQGLYDISIQGIWTYHEMELFEMAVRDMLFGFGGDDNFRLVFSGTNIVRYRENGGSEVSLPLNEVQIRNSQFHKGDDFARWVFIHEFGHRLDIMTGLTASIALEVYTGSETTGFGCGLPGIDLSGHCGWNPNGDTVSSYAFRANRREDWSEAFAASMFRGNWTNLVRNNTHGIRDDALTVAVDRILFVREQVPLLLNSIDAAPTWGEP